MGCVSRLVVPVPVSKSAYKESQAALRETEADDRTSSLQCQRFSKAKQVVKDSLPPTFWEGPLVTKSVLHSVLGLKNRTFASRSWSSRHPLARLAAGMSLFPRSPWLPTGQTRAFPGWPSKSRRGAGMLPAGPSVSYPESTHPARGQRPPRRGSLAHMAAGHGVTAQPGH